MSRLDYWEFDKELTYFLRNNVTDPKSRGTQRVQNTKVIGSSRTTIQLLETSVKNMKSITVAGSAIEYGTGYTLSEDDDLITFVTFVVPVTDGQTVIFTYQHGETWIYPDLPRKDLSLTSYPRIGIMPVASEISQIGLGTGISQTSMLYDVIVYAENADQLRDIMQDVKDAFLVNKKSFYNVNLILPISISPLIKDEGRNERIISQNFTIEIPFIWES